MKMDLNLVQLLAYTDWNETMVYQPDQATPYDYDWMFAEGGMAKVAQYADGIGPWKPMLVDDASTKDNIMIKPLMKQAKRLASWCIQTPSEPIKGALHLGLTTSKGCWMCSTTK